MAALSGAALSAALLTGASPAAAASFTLSDGLRLEGAVTAAGRRFVTIRTEEGLRLVRREALEAVAVRRGDGAVIRGRFENWEDGSYTLRTEEGVVTVAERVVGEAEASRVAAVETAETETAQEDDADDDRASAGAAAQQSAAQQSAAQQSAVQEPSADRRLADAPSSADAVAEAAAADDVSEEAAPPPSSAGARPVTGAAFSGATRKEGAEAKRAGASRTDGSAAEETAAASDAERAPKGDAAAARTDGARPRQSRAGDAGENARALGADGAAPVDVSAAPVDASAAPVDASAATGEESAPADAAAETGPIAAAPASRDAASLSAPSAAPVAGAAPGEAAALEDEAWMSSPGLADRGDDRFQVLIEGSRDPGPFDNRDRPSGIDTALAELEAAETLSSAAPPMLDFKTPAAPGGPGPDPQDVDRRSDPALATAPPAAAEPSARRDPGAPDAPADLSEVRVLAEPRAPEPSRAAPPDEAKAPLRAPAAADAPSRPLAAAPQPPREVEPQAPRAAETPPPPRSPAEPSLSPLFEDRFALGADAEAGDDPVRGLLSDILSGETDVERRMAPRVGDSPALITAPDPSTPPDAAPAPAEVATLTQAPRIQAPTSPPTGSGAGAAEPAPNARSQALAAADASDLEALSAPAAPLRDPSLDYLDGVLGAARPDPERAPSCARLTRLLAPPLASAARGGEGRPDPAALTLAIGGEFSEETLTGLGEAFYRAAGVAPGAIAAAPGPGGAGVILTAATERLIRPWRLAATPFAGPEAAALALTRGRADVALAPPAPFAGALDERARLIGFDAVALVGHPGNPIRALTRGDLGGLLSGSVFDWSMIEPTVIGRPTLYLPPADSSTLAQMAALAEVRRIRPASVRYIPNPGERIAAALRDPMGLAVAALSAVGEAETIALGRRGAGVRPTLDSIRSGAYPVVTPLYASLETAPAHPAARLFAAFLSRPEGQRALFEAGVTPVAACDPSTCRLSADGIAEARQRLESALAFPTLQLTGAEGARALDRAGPALAAISYPPGATEIPPIAVTRFAETLRRLAREDPEGERAYAVLARAGLVGDAAPLERLERARARAEATALAMRCVGLKAQLAAVDPRALSGAFEPTADSAALRVEVMLAP